MHSLWFENTGHAQTALQTGNSSCGSVCSRGRELKSVWHSITRSGKGWQRNESIDKQSINIIISTLEVSPWCPPRKRPWGPWGSNCTTSSSNIPHPLIKTNTSPNRTSHKGSSKSRIAVPGNRRCSGSRCVRCASSGWLGCNAARNHPKPRGHVNRHPSI